MRKAGSFSKRVAQPVLLALVSIVWTIGCRGLPEANDARPSSYIVAPPGTALALAVRSHRTAPQGKSGLHPLADGRDALAARLALADAAESSLDVQYFIWKNDRTGKVLLEHLLEAADRGVRVRLLLDDIGSMHPDAALLALDSHPHLEVRMFNPVALRTPRLVGALVDFKRINRRMHNKSFTADGQVAIVGGRNVADEYFAAHETANFADLDVAVTGPVVEEVSRSFDLYWNNRSSIPVTALVPRKPAPKKLAELRVELSAEQEAAERSDYAKLLRESPFACNLRARKVPFTWAPATILSDHPDKVSLSPDDSTTHLANQLRKVVNGTRQELFLISPYFVPGEGGVSLLANLRKQGVRVSVVTNSLASTDAVSVHSGYRQYRKALLEAGIELYEMKPTADGNQGIGLAKPGLPGKTALHAKTFSSDRRLGFIGSYNLDPRSNKLNTEMGVLFDNTELAARLPLALEHRLRQDAYQVMLAGHRLSWVSHEGDQTVTSFTEPGASRWKRFKARLLGWLPIEDLL